MSSYPNPYWGIDDIKELDDYVVAFAGLIDIAKRHNAGPEEIENYKTCQRWIQARVDHLRENQPTEQRT